MLVNMTPDFSTSETTSVTLCKNSHQISDVCKNVAQIWSVFAVTNYYSLYGRCLSGPRGLDSRDSIKLMQI